MNDQHFDKAVFDKVAWRAACHRCAVEAIRRARLSETLFVQNHYQEIRARLRKVASANRARAMALASEFGFLNEEEPQPEMHGRPDNDHCPHGLSWARCPMGCERVDLSEPNEIVQQIGLRGKRRAHQ